MKKSRDLQYKTAVPRPNYADAMNCSVADCLSIATNMIFDVLSVCPIHYSIMVDTWHNENYEKLSKQVEGMKDSYELALKLKEETHQTKVKQLNEQHDNQLAVLTDILKTEVCFHIKVERKIRIFFSKIFMRANVLNNPTE